MLNTESGHGSVLNQGPTRDPWLTTMDWALGTDQSLQDMLDCDIKSEIDSVIGGHPELGFSFNELSPLELDEDPVGCHNDLNGWFGSQSLLNGNSNSSNSNFNLDLSGCDAASIMVNPNSVMPHMSVRSPTPNNNTAVSIVNNVCGVTTSTTNAVITGVSSTTTTTVTTIISTTTTALTNGSSKRHFAFSSKLEPKEKFEVQVPKNELQENMAIALDLEEGDLDYEQEGEAGDLESEAERDYENEASESEDEEESEYEEPDHGLERVTGIKLSLPSNKTKATTLLLPTSTIKTLSPQLIKPHQQNSGQNTQQALKVNGITGIRLQNLKFLQSPGQMQQLRRQIYNNNVQVQVHQAAQQQLLQQQQLQQQHQQQQQQVGQLTQLNTGSTTATSRSVRDKDLDPLGQDYDDKLYPKPAYSYSCLIAMALKNSQTGSLPVSEIYNFMCEHFPYFKTAPNGWKNSVRHNLSLNKCFEKIEKPAGNGNQRKGCLWAINPAKIAKMDEEVQKWSRKDPLAIKKAMIYPEQLELLERGEMKYVGSGSGDLSEETESSADEAESPEETVHPHSHSHSHALGLGLGLGHGHLAANSVTDSYDESSQDCDVDVSEQLYDEIDIDENKEALHMQLNISKQESSLDYQLSPSSKRQKTLTSTLQANYVYQPVTTARRKAPLYLTAGATAGSFLKIE